MPELVLASVAFGGYVSIIKLLVFLILFLGALPLLGWVHIDAEALETKSPVWTVVILCAVAAGILVWLLVPIFIIGMLFYMIAVGGTSIAYVKYRNARVLDFDRVLTVDHIKNLLVSKEKKIESLKSFSFITANKNEVPIPEPRTPDFFGYKIAYEILKDASWRRASNIAFSPTPQDYQVAYNVDGVVLKQPNINRDQMEYFIHFVKHLSDLDTNEKRKPQKGKFMLHWAKEQNYTNWEVTTAGSTAGEQVRLKQLMQDKAARLSELGLMPEQLEQFKKFREIKQGLFIISGPEKSGVTTTLYAMLRNHDAFLNNINTLERQPSDQLPNITQNVYSLSDTGTTFAQKLLNVVRMGPDVVGVAGCEDPQTAQVACAAAKDSKIVYLTLSADGVLQALSKFLKFAGDRNVVAQTLLGISNQRLVRKLCPECKQGYTPDKEMLRKFNLSADKTKVLYRAGKVIYDKRGKASTCEHCQGTGYVGRTAIFEIVTINKELAKAIRSQPVPEIAKQFRRAKMLYLQEQALRKVINGTTTINEMIRSLKTKEKKPA
ncbi:MAG: Flp pilus assembly complex ATPase component TadA [Sedimentisphaerales bacterium]|nr:Flp pilus assembly complex ATPase component TadA [Sedimentisphaerales bacterium]